MPNGGKGKKNKLYDNKLSEEVNEQLIMEIEILLYIWYKIFIDFRNETVLWTLLQNARKIMAKQFLMVYKIPYQLD